MESRRHFIAVTGGALVSALAPHALAQDSWPTRPLKMVVPWPPGQATDLAGRIVAQEIAATLGQPVVIDNRPGAGGTIGTNVVAKSDPDGYTLLAASSGPVSITPLLSRTPYDPQRELFPVAMTGISPYVLVTSPSFPARDIREFIELVRANPGKFTFGSSGAGTTSHLFAEALNAAAGLRAVHVPYKGSSPELTDLIGGHVHYSFETAAATMPFVKTAHLKAHGVSLAKGSVLAPGIPPIAEAAGIPGFDLGAWIGVMAPARIPPDALDRLGSAIEQAMKSPDVIRAFTQAAVELDYRPAEAFRSYLASMTTWFGDIIRQANIRVE